MSTALRTRIHAALREIPHGRVATYGDVAALAGAPRAAREVGRTLASLPEDSGLPWWRVVRAGGDIALRAGPGPSMQAALLRDEGVLVDEHGRIDLPRFRWQGCGAMPDEPLGAGTILRCPELE